MSIKQPKKYDQRYCLCKNKDCVFAQQQFDSFTGRLPHNDGASEWCKNDRPITIYFDPVTSNYQTWMLVISIFYHIPVFLQTFLKDVGHFRLPNQGRRTKKQWLINRLHFPGILLRHRQEKKFGLKQNTTLMSPGVGKKLESLDMAVGEESRQFITNPHNTIGFLESHAERVLPANIFQEFLQAKNKFKKTIHPDYLVQAPGISWEEVNRFAAVLKIGGTNRDPLRPPEIAPPAAAALSPTVLSKPRILATIHLGRRKKVIAMDNGSPHLQLTGIPIRLLKGGLLTIYPRMVEDDEAIQVTNDLLANPGVFCQHKINGFNPEPRVQAHFHHEASEDFYGQRQPGYRYNLITMKSRLLQSLPSLCRLAERCRKLCRVPHWNIGTTVVLYRDGTDKMGQHKDNDQGEKLILAVVVDAPATNVRKVVICSDDKEEKIVLYLRRGDAYSMDGQMQENYTHGVVKASEAKGKGNLSSTIESTIESDRRMCIVFRHGKKKMYKKDTGIPCIDLNPSTSFTIDKKEILFGRIRGLREGFIYSREDICRMGVHNSQQKGVSGNLTIGCDTIVVAGKGEVKGEDTLFSLMYLASTSGGGAEGMIISGQNGFLVRVFRTDC